MYPKLLKWYNVPMSEKASGADNQQGRLSEKLTPDYIVGIVDGEGYFSVSAIVDRSQGYDNYNVRLVFGIKLNAEDGEILHSIRDYFGCGTVRFRKDDRKNFCDCLEYQVRDTKSITEIIIPFFQKYPLRFIKKRRAFLKFIEITKMKEKKIHLNLEGLLEIQRLSRQMHL